MTPNENRTESKLAKQGKEDILCRKTTKKAIYHKKNLQKESRSKRREERTKKEEEIYKSSQML